MQRLAKLFVALLLTTTALLVMSPGPVHAAGKDQTKAEAAACTKKFDYSVTKKTYKDGSDDMTKALDNHCFDDWGNCLMKRADTATTYKVRCTTEPGTNAAAHEASEAASEQASSDNPTANGSNDPAVAFAKSKCGKDACNIISNYVNPIIKLLTVLVGLAVVIGIIWGGIQIMTSAGDPQKSANGRNHIRNAVIAMIAYVLLFGILSWLIPGGIL